MGIHTHYKSSAILLTSDTQMVLSIAAIYSRDPNIVSIDLKVEEYWHATKFITRSCNWTSESHVDNRSAGVCLLLLMLIIFSECHVWTNAMIDNQHSGGLVRIYRTLRNTMSWHGSWATATAPTATFLHKPHYDYSCFCFVDFIICDKSKLQTM